MRNVYTPSLEADIVEACANAGAAEPYLNRDDILKLPWRMGKRKWFSFPTRPSG